MRLHYNNTSAPMYDLAQVIAQCEELVQRTKGADCTPDELGYAVKQWLKAKAPNHDASGLVIGIMEGTDLPRKGKDGWVNGVSTPYIEGNTQPLEALAKEVRLRGELGPGQPLANWQEKQAEPLTPRQRHARRQLLAQQTVREVADTF